MAKPETRKTLFEMGFNKKRLCMYAFFSNIYLVLSVVYNLPCQICMITKKCNEIQPSFAISQTQKLILFISIIFLDKIHQKVLDSNCF